MATIPTITMILANYQKGGGAPRGSGSKPNYSMLFSLLTALGTPSVLRDLVFNHNSGGDRQELNPIDGQSRWKSLTQERQNFA